MMMSDDDNYDHEQCIVRLRGASCSTLKSCETTACNFPFIEAILCRSIIVLAAFIFFTFYYCLARIIAPFFLHYFSYFRLYVEEISLFLSTEDEDAHITECMKAAVKCCWSYRHSSRKQHYSKCQELLG